jgi:surface antigen
MYPRYPRKNSPLKRYLAEHRLVSIIAAHCVVLTIFAGALFSGIFGHNLLGAFAQSSCASGDQVYRVASGDTLGTIATRYNTSWQSLASYNKLANANMLYVNQTICIPGKSTAGKTTTTFTSLNAARGASNTFPYAQCTWFADERYHALTGIYVPWTTNSNAWQWTMRAQQYNWHVSSSPSRGSIMVLQPWTQGAYGLGHVGVVENILSNGHVIASNMNWGGHGATVINVEFTPGPGVSFVTA